VSRPRPLEPTAIVSARMPEGMIAELDRFAAELQAATTRRISRGEAMRLVIAEFLNMRRAAATAEG
jgi:hypothetical protein